MIANSNLFERFAILDAGVASIYDVKTGELESIIQNCNSFQLTVKSDSKDVKEQGEVAMSFSLPLQGTLKFNAETTTFQQLSLALGSAGLVCNTEKEQYQKTEDFVVTDTTNIVFSLSNEAKSSNDVFVYLATRDGELAKKLTFSLATDKKTITVTPNGNIEEGDAIKIVYATMIPVGKLYSFKVPSRGTNYTKRIVIDVLGTNKNDQSPMMMQYDIHKCIVNNGVDITMDAENPSKFTIEMKVLSDATRKYDANTNGFFDVLIPAEDDTSSLPSAPSISNLSIVSSVAGEASATFSPATGSTSISLKYKLSSNTLWTNATNTVADTDTSATITGLTSGSSYDFKIVYIYDGTTYESNVVTNITIA